MNISILREYETNGWLMSQTHPTLPLIIWNYTTKTQYEGKWDDITLKCRGLVTDTEGTIVSKGFDKFFNYEENRHVATDQFDVYEKMDGQYIGVFWYKGEMIVNSRGSFTSKYARFAKQWLLSRHPRFCKYPIDGLTYCFELCGFERVVCLHDRIKMVLIGIFNVLGTDWYADLKDNWDLEYLPNLTEYRYYTQLKELNWKNREGFVIKFSNGQRCKIKFGEYVELHRKMTNLSTTSIWEAMRTGKSVSDILKTTPDEFFETVRALEVDFQSQYSEIEDMSIRYFNFYKPLLKFGRKVFSERIAPLPNPYKAVVNALADGKDYSEKIWKALKPKFERI